MGLPELDLDSLTVDERLRLRPSATGASRPYRFMNMPNTSLPLRVVACLGALLVTALATTTVARAPRRTLPVPARSFEEIEPYIRAGIVPIVRDGDLEVFVCSGVEDRSTIEPFDEQRAAFTKVLLVQAMNEDQSLYAALHAATATFREDSTAWVGKDLAALRASFWQRLARDPHVYPKLRRRFEKALRRGQLRCWLCERDETFAPDGLRELEQRAR